MKSGGRTGRWTVRDAGTGRERVGGRTQGLDGGVDLQRMLVGLGHGLQLMLVADGSANDRVGHGARPPLQVRARAGTGIPGRRDSGLGRVESGPVLGVLAVKSRWVFETALDGRGAATDLLRGGQLPQLLRGTVRRPSLVVVVDEVAAGSVRTQSGRVERPTEVRLVLGMAHDGPQFRLAVSELALASVAARSVLLVRTTQLCLIAGRRGAGGDLPGRHPRNIRALVLRDRFPDALGSPLDRPGRQKPRRQESRIAGAGRRKVGLVGRVEGEREAWLERLTTDNWTTRRTRL